MRRVGPYDVEISAHERLLNRPATEVRLHFEPRSDTHAETYAMDPAFARRLARRLMKYAKLAEGK